MRSDGVDEYIKSGVFLLFALALYIVPVTLGRKKYGKRVKTLPACGITLVYTFIVNLFLNLITDKYDLAALAVPIGTVVVFLILVLKRESDKADSEDAWNRSTAQEKPESPSGSFATTYSSASEYSRPDSRPAAAAPQKSGSAAPPREPAGPRSHAVPMPDAQRPKPKPAPKPRPEPEDEDDFFDDGGDWLEDEFYDDEAFDDYDAD